MPTLFDQLTSMAAVQALIDEGARESEVLEYKISDTPFTDRDKGEIAKDVSAMANSLGGVIVYGIATDPADKTLPRRLVPIDPRNIETFDRVLNAQVRPPVNGLRRKVLPEANPQVFVVEVPESQDPPHQSLYDKRYYRRSGVECLPMEHDLVALKFGRKLSPVLELTIQPISAPGEFQGEPALTAPGVLRLFVRNIGRRVGRDVVGLLRFPPSEFVRVQTVHGNLSNIDRLYEGQQARQLGPGTSIYHPGMHTSVADVQFVFTKAATALPQETAILEWTLMADEMEARVGAVSLASIGWVIPKDGADA